MLTSYHSNMSFKNPTVLINGSQYNHRQKDNVYFFLDFSNIKYSGSQLSCLHGDGIFSEPFFRLSLSNLRALAQQGRHWAKGFSAAALTKPSNSLRTQMTEAGILFEQSEKGAVSGREQNVDERIQVEMYKLLNPNITRGHVVLASGDGAGHKQGSGFLPALQSLLHGGFSIEVLSWDHSLNRELKEWAQNNGRVVILDPFYSSITCIHNGRQATSRRELQRRMARLNITDRK